MAKVDLSSRPKRRDLHSPQPANSVNAEVDHGIDSKWDALLPIDRRIKPVPLHSVDSALIQCTGPIPHVCRQVLPARPRNLHIGRDTIRVQDHAHRTSALQLIFFRLRRILRVNGTPEPGLGHARIVLWAKHMRAVCLQESRITRHGRMPIASGSLSCKRGVLRLS